MLYVTCAVILVNAVYAVIFLRAIDRYSMSLDTDEFVTIGLLFVVNCIVLFILVFSSDQAISGGGKSRPTLLSLWIKRKRKELEKDLED